MARNRNSSTVMPADFDRTRAVAVCNPMAPPLLPKIVISALLTLQRNITAGRGDGLEQFQSAEERVADALRRMSMTYTNLGKAHKIPQPDFADAAYRWAYVYQYLTKHCHLIYQMLWLLLPFDITKRWLERGVDVCSVGGGPGTDVIGVLVYLQSVRSYLGKPACERVVGHVLDKFATAWNGAWLAIRESNSVLKKSQIYCKYIACDLLADLPTAAMEQEIRQADLVTMIKSFSAFVAFMRDGRDIRQCAVAKLLKQMKRGAAVLFIDNKDEAYVDRASSLSFMPKTQNKTLLRDIAKPAGLEILGQWHGNTETLLLREDYRDLKRYQEQLRLDWNPLRKCAVSVFLLYKP
ncbi:uncharacterized protein LOC110985092 [Acanthaster planci]|uniref:Uncharacterized protein LOC110985092 n=1 Tax=Acanthaster planci TaxID=133434 RepID=A0A8B7Z9P9_ACAPL|nr:uncharacterized protein LOC110985092 [Acanthaster planci]